MIKAKTEQYIYPPRSQDAIPRKDTEIFSTLGWIAQYKYNDTHALIKYCPNGKIELWNRHAERFRKYTTPDWLLEQLEELGQKINHIPGNLTILDGGLLDQKHKAIKDTIVIWDMLVLNNEYLIGTEYANRLSTIHQNATDNQTWNYKDTPFGYKISNDILTPMNINPQDWETAWETIDTINKPFTIGQPTDPDYQCHPVLEGLVFKDPQGQLEPGFSAKNNDSWMIRSRVKTGRHNF